MRLKELLPVIFLAIIFVFVLNLDNVDDCENNTVKIPNDLNSKVQKFSQQETNDLKNGKTIEKEIFAKDTMKGIFPFITYISHDVTIVFKMGEKDSVNIVEKRINSKSQDFFEEKGAILAYIILPMIFLSYVSLRINDKQKNNGLFLSSITIPIIMFIAYIICKCLIDMLIYFGTNYDIIMILNFFIILIVPSAVAVLQAYFLEEYFDIDKLDIMAIYCCAIIVVGFFVFCLLNFDISNADVVLIPLSYIGTYCLFSALVFGIKRLIIKD